MAGFFTLLMLLGCLLFIIGFKVIKLTKLKKYGITLFMIGLLPLVSREITRSYIDKEVSTQASQSIASESSSQNSIEKPQVNSADKAVSPTVKTEIKTIKEKAFSWDEFDASPERAKLGDDVIRMQNNNLKGAHFLPVNYGKSNLEKFMRENNLKFTMASLDCFSSDTHCSLTIAITRSKYPSKANGDFCGPMARWTAPYKDLNAWETDLRSPLDQLLFQGNAQGVLNKIDYEYERRCS
ncbi:hypothetical protein CDG57_01465 [Acinetobacter junii]|nr:hypothetical protein CDG57_01465 [Acinetobacter junii]